MATRFQSRIKFNFSIKLLLLFVSAAVCYCQEGAVVTSVSGFYPQTNGEQTLGFIVSTAKPLDVTALGMYRNGANGFRLKHSVGIWDAAGGFPLAKVDFSPGTEGFARGDFVYKALPLPIRLFPGGRYAFGASYAESTNDQFGIVTGWAPELVAAFSAYSSADSGFTFPAGGAGWAYGGPNALFIPLESPLFLNNSGFESAHDIPQFDLQGHPWIMPATNALPGWDCYIGSGRVDWVSFNDLALDSAWIGLLTADSPYLPDGLAVGQYAASLQAGFGPLGMKTPVSIAQNILMPPDVVSVRFRGNAGGGYGVAFNGEPLPLTIFVTKGKVSGYAADVSRFSGHVGELRLTSFGHFNFIDGIVLSKSPIAEPSPKVVQDFSLNPVAQGWTAWGDRTLFNWSPESERLDATWNSSKPNSYFALPLGTVLSSLDSFAIEFDLTLTTATSNAKSALVPIAIGLQNSTDAHKADFLRASGTNSPNLLEFDLYPRTNSECTVQVAVLSTNSYSLYWSNNVAWAEPIGLQLELPPGVTLHVSLNYIPEQKWIYTTLTTNSVTITNNWLTAIPSAIDFRLNTFTVASYAESARLDGLVPSLLANGIVDNVRLTFPMPIEGTRLDLKSSSNELSFRSRPNWSYSVQRSETLFEWEDVYKDIFGDGRFFHVPLLSTDRPYQFYRVLVNRVSE